MSVATTVSRQKVIYLTAASSSPWTIPVDWSNTANKVECIGGGASGAGGGNPGDVGGGGGAYSATLNVSLTGGGTAQFQVGTGGAVGVAGNNTVASTAANGGNTWFNGTSLASCSAGAEGGYAYVSHAGTSWGAGGSVANSVGSTKYAGGNSGISVDNNQRGASGGGGAGGPLGKGGDGGSIPASLVAGLYNSSVGGGGNGGGTNGNQGLITTDDYGATEGGASGTGQPGGFRGYGTILYANNSHRGFDGQAGYKGSGGGGGSAAGFDGAQIGTGAGGDGGAGDEFDPIHGSGGGGGGSGGSGSSVTTLVCSSGGKGGLYGGGGGGGGTNDSNNGIGVMGPGGAGANGLIVITYTSTNTALTTNSKLQTLSKSDATWSVPTAPTSNNGTANNLTFASYSVTSGDYLIVIAHKSSTVSAAMISADCTLSAGTATIAGFTLDKTLEGRGGFDTVFYSVGIWSTKVTGTGTITVRVGSATAADKWCGSVTPIRPSSTGTLALLSSNTGQSGTNTLGGHFPSFYLLNTGITITTIPSIVFSAITVGSSGGTMIPAAQPDFTSIVTDFTSVTSSDCYRIFNAAFDGISHSWQNTANTNNFLAAITAIAAYGISNTTPRYLSTIRL